MHTKGPWTYREGSEPHYQSTVWQEDGRAIAVCYNDEDAANARLIAAAPELEAALLEAYSLLCSIADYDYWDEDEQDVATIRRAEAALLAARPLTA